MYGGKRMGILGEGCRGLTCQESGNWGRQKRRYAVREVMAVVEVKRMLQKIGTTGDGKERRRPTVAC